jgi:hypothetical protein
LKLTEQPVGIGIAFVNESAMQRRYDGTASGRNEGVNHENANGN